MRWGLKELAREEEGEVWVGYNKMRINGEWWFWDEKIEDVRNWRGNQRGRKTGGGRLRKGKGQIFGEEGMEMGEAGKGKLSRKEGRWLEERGVGG